MQAAKIILCSLILGSSINNLLASDCEEEPKPYGNPFYRYNLEWQQGKYSDTKAKKAFFRLKENEAAYSLFEQQLALMYLRNENPVLRKTIDEIYAYLEKKKNKINQRYLLICKTTEGNTLDRDKQRLDILAGEFSWYINNQNFQKAYEVALEKKQFYKEYIKKLEYANISLKSEPFQQFQRLVVNNSVKDGKKFLTEIIQQIEQASRTSTPDIEDALANLKGFSCSYLNKPFECEHGDLINWLRLKKFKWNVKLELTKRYSKKRKLSNVTHIPRS